MEAIIDINPRIVEWLASMGYPVRGMPGEMLAGMFMREARQWQLSPEHLEALIYEAPAGSDSSIARLHRDAGSGDGRSGLRTPDHIRARF